MKYADLHIHTHLSDGTFSPGEVVNRAISGGLSALAITDHDSVDALSEAVLASAARIELIPGIELTAQREETEIHILGYFIDWKDAEFQIQLKSLQNLRWERARKIVEKLNELGIEINYDDLLEFAGKTSVTRLHIARLMVSSGYVSSLKEAFGRFIGEGKPACIGRFELLPGEAIKMIKKVGGIAVLAHPYLMNHEEWIPEFIQNGLCGIEVYHSSHTPQAVAHFERLAHKYNLLVTGGSDCHGLAKGKILLGKFKVPYTLVERLKETKKAQEIEKLTFKDYSDIKCNEVDKK